jgi:hypothetical protein
VKGDPNLTPDQAAKLGRRFRRIIAVAVAAGLLALVGALVAYVQDQALINGPTRPVTGVVQQEQKGGILNSINVLSVAYDVDGRHFEESIPVTGDGFGGVKIAPYFYKVGEPVSLLVARADPQSVRTVDRWVPGIQNWGAVAAVCWGVVLLIGSMWLVVIRPRYANPEAKTV